MIKRLAIALTACLLVFSFASAAFADDAASDSTKTTTSMKHKKSTKKHKKTKGMKGMKKMGAAADSTKK